MSDYRLKMTDLLWRDGQAFCCFVGEKEHNVSFVTKCCQWLGQGGKRKAAAFVEVFLGNPLLWQSVS